MIWLFMSTKANFYRQITLPSNIDAASLSIHHHHDKKLYITIKLLDEYSSIKVHLDIFLFFIFKLEIKLGAKKNRFLPIS